MSTSTASPYLREQSDSDAAFVDRVMAVAPPEVQERVRRYPLNRDQSGALRVLIDQGNGDFLWSNASTTERLLSALANKGLAIRGTTTDRWGRERATYRPLPAMRGAHLEAKRAREQAYREERDRKDAERQARVAAGRAALERDVATLLAALDVLEQGDVVRDRLDVDPKDLAAARERVERLRQTSDFFLG